MPVSSQPGITELGLLAEVESCLTQARQTEVAVSCGERLAAARAAVELAKAYDKVLDSIRLVPLSIAERQRVRDRLTPVAELLRKYRLR